MKRKILLSVLFILSLLTIIMLASCGGNETPPSSLESTPNSYPYGSTEGDHTHSWSFSGIIKSPTCKEAGQERFYCNLCGKERIDDIEPVLCEQGDWVTVKEPTCSEEGLKIISCIYCEEELFSSSIGMLAHTSGGWETIKEPTCSEYGSEGKSCTVCGEVTISRKLSKTKHEAKDEPVMEDFVSVGKKTLCQTYSLVTYCKFCDKKLDSESKEIYSHNYLSKEHTLPLGTTFSQLICSDCKYSYQDTDIISLDFNYYDYLASYIKKNGYRSYYENIYYIILESNYNERVTYYEDEGVIKISHDDTDYSPTYMSVQFEMTLTRDSLFHPWTYSFSSASASAEVSGTLYAPNISGETTELSYTEYSYSGVESSEELVVSLSVDSLNLSLLAFENKIGQGYLSYFGFTNYSTHKHSFALTNATLPSCTTGATITHKCSGCSLTVTEDVEALGHTIELKEIISNETCQEVGTATYSCSFCSFTEDKTIDSKHHPLEVVSSSVAETTYVCEHCNEEYTTANEYTVTYNPNGGEMDSTTQTVVFGAPTSLYIPTRENYIFAGWHTSDGTLIQSELYAYNFVSLNLTAEWTKVTYSISFNSGYDANIPNIDGIALDEEFTLPEPERTGYTFRGWYLDSEQLTSGTWEFLSNISLNAKWDALSYNVTYNDVDNKEYTVKYVYNNPDQADYTCTVSSTSYATFRQPYSRSGYIFCGWYTNRAMTNYFDFKSTIKSDMTLYARWEEIPDLGNNVSVSVLSPTKDLQEFSKSTYGVNVAFVVATESGKHEICYRYDSTNSSYGYYLIINNLSSGETLLEKTAVMGQSVAEYDWIEFECNAGDIISLTYAGTHSYVSGTACFAFGRFDSGSRKAYGEQVTHGKYVESSTVTALIDFDQKYDLLQPTRAGYNFLGWYDENDNLITLDGKWNIAKDLTLTSKWEKATYKVSLDSNNGSCASSTIELGYNDTLTLPDNERKGYTFLGWFDENNQYTTGVFDESRDITLVSRWQANEYTVTYNDATTDYVLTFVNGSNISTTTVKAGQMASFNTPTKSGYFFTGWYLEDGTRYNFRGPITRDMTLTAGWISHSYSNIKTLTASSASGYSVSSDTKECYKYMITINETGEHTIYYSSGSASLEGAGYTIEIRNITTKTAIANEFVGAGDRSSATFTCNAGDVIYIGFSSETRTGYRYVNGVLRQYTEYLGTTATMSFDGFDPSYNATNESTTPHYKEGVTTTEKYLFDSEFNLPKLTREGYTFLGWYDEDGNKVTMSSYSYDRDIVLTAKWKAN